MANKYHDISWPITPAMTSYKDKKPIAITAHATIERDGVADSSCTMNMHTGTHIDAPAHFINGGQTVEQLSLAQMNGACRVIDLTHVSDVITPADLTPHNIASSERVLFKTRNSMRGPCESFDRNSVYVDAQAAAYLVDCGAVLVGIDALGIERNQPNHDTHTTLFTGGVIILEGLRLAAIAPGIYNLMLLPLAFNATEAAPARAVLVQ